MFKGLAEMVRKLFYTKLGRGSLVMVVGSFGVGFVSFLFNPIMGNFLGPVGYGELVTLLSVLVILSVPSLTLNTVLIKFSAQYQAKGDLDSVKTLFLEATKKITIFSLVLILLLWLGKATIASFLQVNDEVLLVLVGLLTVMTIFFTINGAFLQGILNFEAYTLTSFLNSLLRIIFAVLFIYLGFSVGGALVGLITASLVAYLLSLWFLRKILTGKEINTVKWKDIYFFVGPAFVSLFGLTLLNNIDLILVKHFFSPREAGFYSAATVAGRVIVFASLPITQVIFPLVVQRFESGKPYHHLVIYATSITVIIGSVVATLYWLLPSLVLKGFFLSRSSEYSSAASLLAPYGVFISVFSLNTLFIYLFLSLHKIRFALAPFVFSLLQGTLIWSFHNSLNQVIFMNTLTNVSLFVTLLIYYWKDLKRVERV